MPTNAGRVRDATLQKFVDAVISSIKLPDGSHPAAAPNAWKDRYQQQINADDTAQFEICVRTNPDGNSASVFVLPIGSKAQALVGVIDVNVLATKLV